MNFGLGTTFLMGEEAIFINDCKNKGLKIGFVPQQLLSHSQQTTGNRTPVSEIYFVLGAVFYRIFGKMFLFWIALKLFFDIKQGKINFLVNGVNENLYYDCYTSREYNDMCGEEGKYYKKKIVKK